MEKYSLCCKFTMLEKMHVKENKIWKKDTSPIVFFKCCIWSFAVQFKFHCSIFWNICNFFEIVFSALKTTTSDKNISMTLDLLVHSLAPAKTKKQNTVVDINKRNIELFLWEYLGYNEISGKILVSHMSLSDWKHLVSHIILTCAKLIGKVVSVPPNAHRVLL